MTHTRNRRAAWAALAIAGTAVAAAPAAAHDTSVSVNCERARFVYTDNARGEQRAVETVTVDGVQLYQQERRWTTGGRVDTFDVPLTVYGRGRVLVAIVAFVGSDGYRYTRSFRVIVDCPDEPVPPTPPEPPVPPTPPIPPVPVDTPPPPTTTPVPPTPPTPPTPPKTRKPPLPKPTVCRTFARKPANAITRGVPRPGQIRVRYVKDVGWVGYRRDRFHRVTVAGKTRVLFTPGFFCGPRPDLEVTG